MPRFLLVLIAGLLALLSACANGRRDDFARGSLDLTAQLRQLGVAAAPSGVDGALWRQLKSALAAQLEARAKDGRIALTAPIADASRAVLTIDSIDQELIWSYYSQGDYDQNGEVNIGDLTPLGLHFGAASGGGSFNAATALSVIDGDGNGEINLADLTPIGINFGRACGSYNIYHSADPADLPAGNTDPNGSGATLLATVPLSGANGTAATDRLALGFALGAAPDGVYWVRPNEAADGSGQDGTPSTPAGPAAPITSSLKIYQNSFDFGDGVVYPDTTWGAASVTFTGVEEILYFSLTYNGTEVFRNVPLFSDQGIGVPNRIDLPFNLGNAEGELVQNCTAAYTLDPAPKTSSSARQASETSLEVFGQILGDQLEGGADNADHPAPAAAPSGKVNDDTTLLIANSGHRDFTFQPVSHRERTVASVSDSLGYLRNHFGLAIGPEFGKFIDKDTMKDALGAEYWAEFYGGTKPDWPERKNDYMKANDYPIVTTKTYDFDEAFKAMQDECDVEMTWQDIGVWQKMHTAVALTWMGKMSDGTAQVLCSGTTVAGESYHAGAWLAHSTEDGYTQNDCYMYFGNARVAFVIECPKAGSTWHERNIFSQTIQGGANSPLIKPDGSIGLTYQYSWLTQEIRYGELVPPFFIQAAPPLNLDPQPPGRSFGANNQLIELPSGKYACVFQEQSALDPDQNQILCCVSTDDTCTGWNPEVVLDTDPTTAIGESLDCAVVGGKLAVCYTASADLRSCVALDDDCTAFSAPQGPDFNFGWDCQMAQDDAGNVCVAQLRTDHIELYNNYDCEAGTGGGPVLIGTDVAEYDLLYCPNAHKFELCYVDTSGEVLETQSADQTTWSPAQPVPTGVDPVANLRLVLGSSQSTQEDKILAILLYQITAQDREIAAQAATIDQIQQGGAWEPAETVGTIQNASPNAGLGGVWSSILDSWVIFTQDLTGLNLGMYWKE